MPSQTDNTPVEGPRKALILLCRSGVVRRICDLGSPLCVILSCNFGSAEGNHLIELGRERWDAGEDAERQRLASLAAGFGFPMGE